MNETANNACQCVTCTCTGCHEECYGSCHSCGEPKDHCNSYQTGGAKFIAGLKTLESERAETQTTPALDTSWMDIQAQVDLELATREYLAGRDMAQRGIRRMADAVAIAHDATCASYATNGHINTVFANCKDGEMTEKTVVRQPRNGESGKFEKAESTFKAWCANLGIELTSAYRLLNVAKMFDESSPKEQKILNELSPSLLYAAARPSAPPELVAGVKSGDITTHKQYQDLLAELQAEKEGRVNDNRNLMDEINARGKRIDELIEASEQHEDQLNAVTERANKAASRNIGLIQEKSRLEIDNRDLLNDNRDLQERITSLTEENRRLNARPIDVAVRQPSEAEIEKYRREGEQRAQKLLDELRAENRQLRETAEAAGRAVQVDPKDFYRAVNSAAGIIIGLAANIERMAKETPLTNDELINYMEPLRDAADALTKIYFANFEEREDFEDVFE